MPRINVNNIFDAEPYTTGQVLCEPGVGFYVPIYQREYNWDKKHIVRLFEDIANGLQLLVENENSITFLGTLIVIDRAIPANVDKGELPSNVRIVIDGQQRLTTILLMNICLHDEIRRRGSKFNVEYEPAFQWLYNETIDVTAQLKRTFAEYMNRGDGIYKWYPRMIRENDDTWSRSEPKAVYKSPIAAFIHGYLKHIKDDNNSIQDDINPKRYKGNLDLIDKNNALLKKYRDIQQKIESVCKGGDEDLEMPLLKKIVENPGFQEAIFQDEFPEGVRAALSNEGNEDFKQLIRLVLFANFLMEGVTVTFMVVYKEDYAFDMFESLNTTGEPLTAFETFKPKVIEAEEWDKYENSVSRELLKPVEEYMEEFKDAQKRHTGTSRLLIPFALAETGETLPKRHSNQRKYLRDQYDKLENIEEKRKFVEHLSHTARFFNDAWKKKEHSFQSIESFSDREIVLICMDMLGKVNHEIAIAPLVRFYSQIIHSNFSPEAVRELEGSIKAITTFFTFWRGIRKETGYLAAGYRELMKNGTNGPESQSQAFCRCQEDGEILEYLTAQKLQESLRYILKEEGGISCKRDWVRLSSEQPIYQGHKTLARFLLFAAMHNTSKDEKNPGLRTSGRQGVLNMLTWEIWDQDLEIEHIAPKNPVPDTWQESLYDKPNLVDCLGNLTLLPKAENSSFSNRPWHEKKRMFDILVAPTLEEQKARLTNAREQRIELAENTENLLSKGRYFRHLSAISNAEEWTDEFVQNRSKRLAKLIWTNIAPWLGFTDE